MVATMQSFVLVLVLSVFVAADTNGGGPGDDIDIGSLAAKLATPCNFFRTASLDEAVRVWKEGVVPVLFEASGADGNTWPTGMSQWDDLAALSTQHGNVQVETRLSALAVANGGVARKAAATATPSVTTSFADVLSSWENASPASRALVFSRAELQLHDGQCETASSSAGWLESMKGALGWLGDRLPSATDTGDALILSAGPAGAGLPGHSHGAAWLALAAGSKFWLVRPRKAGDPQTSKATAEEMQQSVEWAASPYPPLHWLRQMTSGDVDPGSNGGAHAAGSETAGDGGTSPPDSESPPDSVRWCVQHPKEIVFLPAYCHHATLNVKDSVAFGGQRNKFEWSDRAAAFAGFQAELQGDRSNPRLLEAFADSLLGGAASATLDTPAGNPVALLVDAVAAEPLNVRLALRAAHAISRAGGGAKAHSVLVAVLHSAAAAIDALEAASGVAAHDLAQASAEVGVAVVTLAKEQATLAVQLLTRATADEGAGSNPGSFETLLYYLAYAHGKAGNKPTAMRLLQEVLRRNPSHQDARTILAALSR